MMNIAQEPLFQWLSQYAYQPHMVYLAVVTVMIASGFGFPIPEEVSIVSVGLLSYLGAHPNQFPPPYPGAPVVQGYEAAAVTLIAILFTDCLIFSIGRIFGRKVVEMPRFARIFTPSRLGRINSWVKRYGAYAVFVFRFTPGIRFPAHIILGMSRIHAWQFALVDGVAAMISVPTQILLIYHFGEPILHILHQFKLWILWIIAAAILFLLIKTYVLPRFKRPQPSDSDLTP
jgi:membrane protein DedA with SNARE-associated domain